MKDRISEDLGEQIVVLEEMIEKTEMFYGLISEQLPAIESEIDDTIEETELLINYFTDSETDDPDLEDGFQILEVLETLEMKINKVYDSLSARENISRVLDSFVSDSNNEKTDFHQILSLIDELRKILKKLNNLAINAIIFSVKSDKEGASFRVISDEINKLSKQIKKEYDGIKMQIENLQQWNKNFASELEQLIERETRISNEYKLELTTIFSDVLDSLQTTSNILKDFMDHVKKAVEPVYDIIILVQNQDIIRQNSENLIEIISTLQQEIDKFNFSEDDNKEILNRLVFIINAAKLSQRLMDNILNQLNDSLFDIQNKFTKMKNDLLEIDEEGEQLVNFFAGDNNQQLADNTSIDLIYQRLIDFVPKLIEQLEKLDLRYQEITTNNNQFYENLEGLETGFAEIDKIADRFKKIELLAKIEFTRISGSNNSFIQNIEDAIETFIESSANNQDLYFSLKDKLITDYEKFLKFAKANQRELNDSADIISDSEDKLLLTKKMIKEAIQGLHSSVKNLISNILEVEEELDAVQSLENKGSKVIEALSNLEEESSQLKEKYLEKLGAEEWEESNQRLQKLEERFTSYLERKTAQEELQDVDIDAGSEGGELTLF